MEAIVLNVESLPLFFYERFHSPKVKVQEQEGGIMLIPLNESSGLLGIAENDNLTLEKFLAFKKEDKEFEQFNVIEQNEDIEFLWVR